MNNGFSVVNHVGITVSNLEKLIEFYETLTGKKISNQRWNWWEKYGSNSRFVWYFNKVR